MARDKMQMLHGKDGVLKILLEAFWNQEKLSEGYLE
jgi:hypothetical protein